MQCAWQAYLNLIPEWMRNDVDRQGRDNLQELRLRMDRPPELITEKGNVWLDQVVSEDDLTFCVNTASRYSPWASTSIQYGYITAPGGHRLGICGDVATVNEKVTTITNVTSICLRVARDFPGLGMKLAALTGSILIVGPPGSGKTTLLRDCIRQKSNIGFGSIAVVDERKELFPVVNRSFCFSPGKATDVLSGCGKYEGLDMLIRTVSPQWIAVDEITASHDTKALIYAGWCGISLLATAHAGSIQDLKSRQIYRPLLESGLFENVVVMGRDKSWNLERINI